MEVLLTNMGIFDSRPLGGAEPFPFGIPHSSKPLRSRPEPFPSRPHPFIPQREDPCEGCDYRGGFLSSRCEYCWVKQNKRRSFGLFDDVIYYSQDKSESYKPNSHLFSDNAKQLKGGTR